MISKSVLALLFLALAVALGIQLPHLNRPPFDYHNFRQAQTLSTIELYAKDGIDLFRPRVNYFGEPGIIILEFPIFQAVCASLYKLAGWNIALIRTFSVLLTIGTGCAVFAIARKRIDQETAFAAAILYFCSPLNLAYMSAILIDPLAVCAAVWAFYLCDRLLEASGSSRTTWFLLTVTCAITALVKPLYLFSVCVLIAVTVVQRRGFPKPLVKASISMVVAGLLFVAWNTYAIHVNNGSFFTRNFRPTMLLGFSELFSFGFIRRMGRWILIETVGPLAGFAVLAGWMSVVLPWVIHSNTKRIFLFICALATLGYWATFAHITYIHDYYSLIVVPFCAITAGAACATFARSLASKIGNVASSTVLSCSMAVIGAAASAGLFIFARGFPPSTSAQEFARLSAGRFEPFSYAMIFISADRSPGGNPIHDAPVMLEAAGLLGTSLVVADTAQAREQWQKFGPHYNSLRYVVFFGLSAPPEIVAAYGSPVVRDESAKFTTFDLARKP